MDQVKRNLLWAQVKKKYGLSRSVVQMAKELGLNPKKIGKIANHNQQPWKSPLPVFIQELYEERFSNQKMDDTAKQGRTKKGPYTASEGNR